MIRADGKYLHSQEVRDKLDRASLLRQQGEYEEAFQILYILLGEYPDDPVILNNLGNVYLSEGKDYDEAERCFLEAYRKAPDLTIILSNLSRLYAKTGHHKKAADYARRVLASDPKSPYAWNTLGLYYARQGELNAALDYFLASYSYDKAYYTGVYNAACALTQLRRFDEALQYLEISLAEESSYIAALNDNSLDLLRNLDDFKRIMTGAGERFGGDNSG